MRLFLSTVSPAAMALVFFLMAVSAVIPGARADEFDLEIDPHNLRTASLYIQPVMPLLSQAASSAQQPLPEPSLLAEIHYNWRDPSDSAQVAVFEPPQWPSQRGSEHDEQEAPGSALYRIGAYDLKARKWLSATSVTAAANFAKGYRPQLVLTVAETAAGQQQQPVLLSAFCRGVAIDAGATRDFGPQATVVVSDQGATPVLNRPVVLSPEGKKAPPPEEKTFLQKYWWAIGIAVVMLMTTGGGEDPK